MASGTMETSAPADSEEGITSILLLSDHWSRPCDNLSSATRYICKLFRSRAKQGVNIRLLITGSSTTRPISGDDREELGQLDVEVFGSTEGQENLERIRQLNLNIIIRFLPEEDDSVFNHLDLEKCFRGKPNIICLIIDSPYALDYFKCNFQRTIQTEDTVVNQCRTANHVFSMGKKIYDQFESAFRRYDYLYAKFQDKCYIPKPDTCISTPRNDTNTCIIVSPMILSDMDDISWHGLDTARDTLAKYFKYCSAIPVSKWVVLLHDELENNPSVVEEIRNVLNRNIPDSVLEFKYPRTHQQWLNIVKNSSVCLCTSIRHPFQLWVYDILNIDIPFLIAESSGVGTLLKEISRDQFRWKTMVSVPDMSNRIDQLDYLVDPHVNKWYGCLLNVLIKRTKAVVDVNIQKSVLLVYSEAKLAEKRFLETCFPGNTTDTVYINPRPQEYQEGNRLGNMAQQETTNAHVSPRTNITQSHRNEPPSRQISGIQEQTAVTEETNSQANEGELDHLVRQFAGLRVPSTGNASAPSNHENGGGEVIQMPRHVSSLPNRSENMTHPATDNTGMSLPTEIVQGILPNQQNVAQIATMRQSEYISETEGESNTQPDTQPASQQSTISSAPQSPGSVSGDIDTGPESENSTSPPILRGPGSLPNETIVDTGEQQRRQMNDRRGQQAHAGLQTQGFGPGYVPRIAGGGDLPGHEPRFRGNQLPGRYQGIGDIVQNRDLPFRIEHPPAQPDNVDPRLGQYRSEAHVNRELREALEDNTLDKERLRRLCYESIQAKLLLPRRAAGIYYAEFPAEVNFLNMCRELDASQLPRTGVEEASEEVQGSLVL